MVLSNCGMIGFNCMSGMMGWTGFGLLSLIALVVVFWALIDAINSKRLDTGKKIAWVLIILVGWFLPLSLLGAVAYFIAGKKR